VSISVTPIRDADRRIVGVATIARDISRQKDAETRLREREEQYRGVFAATSDGLAIFEPDSGALIDANPAFCAMHGYEREALLGLDPLGLIHPDYRHLLGELLGRVRAGGRFQGRTRHLHRDGSTLPLEVIGLPFRHGGRSRGLAVFRDVTEQDRAMRLLEEGVQERTRELATLLDVARDVASTRELAPLMEVILDQLKRVVDYDAATVLAVQDGALVPFGRRMPPGAPPDSAPAVFELSRPDVRVLWETTRGQGPLIIDDLHGPEPAARALHSALGRPAPDTLPFARAWLGVPLVARDRTIGVLSMWSGRVGFFAARHAELAGAVAAHAAVAIENARLHAETERRLRDTEVLYRADEALHGSLRVDDVLQALVDVAVEAVGADKTAVMLWDEAGERLAPRAWHGFAPAAARFSVARGEGVVGAVAASGRPSVVEDAAGDRRVLRYLVEAEGIRSLMAIPVAVGDEVVGVFAVCYCQPHRFGADEQRLLLALARRAGAAIENARLFGRAERVARELATLLEVSRNLAGTLALEPLLGVVLEELRAVIGYGSAAILTLEGDELLVRDYRGPRRREDVVNTRLALPGALLFRAVLERRAPLMIGDTADGSEPARLFRRRNQAARRAFPPSRSWLGVPLVAKDRVIGMLRLDHPEPRRFGETDATLALAVANQAAVAIENARLYAQAQQQATADERQRLARELHDAVTQTLFSASLIADVLPRIWADDPDGAREGLEEVRQLTRGALAEMRTLLLELRPAALTETGLGELLAQLTGAFTGRTRVPAALEVTGDGAVPPEVQVALYRVAQEALNNVAKYAGARRVQVALALAPHRVELTVEDDGRGFDPDAVEAGHLGLGIMRERCAGIGARLAIRSRAGSGTRVTATWSAARSGRTAPAG
jgi:two-component system nitrate/nitrite sensor histidine kinase NarX